MKWDEVYQQWQDSKEHEDAKMEYLNKYWYRCMYCSQIFKIEDEDSHEKDCPKYKEWHDKYCPDGELLLKELAEGKIDAHL